MTMHYYNEFDHKAAAWLRVLMDFDLIPKGEVDERSITDVCASDLRGYTQCHFFAGIGGWPLALHLAGVSADTRLWTGSCPCQPFSHAGKRKGMADERHLWPVFAELIAECRPATVFGEQVEGAIGQCWLDGVCRDLEREGYAVGAHVLGAHSVGAPHKRQRLYWGAYRGCTVQPVADSPLRRQRADRDAQGPAGHPEQRDEARELAHTQDTDRRCGEPGPEAGTWQDGERRRGSSERCADGLADAIGNEEPGLPGHGWERETCPQLLDSDPWSQFRVIHCRDGKLRRIPEAEAQCGLFAVADGLSPVVAACRDAGIAEAEIREVVEAFPLAGKQEGRVMLLRGSGNAIVPQVAAMFVAAFMESKTEQGENESCVNCGEACGSTRPASAACGRCGK